MLCRFLIKEGYLKMKNKAVFFLLFLILIFSGCSEDSTGPAGDNGRIRIYMVDAPADYDEINIVVDRVEVHKAENGGEGEWIVINSKPGTFNLLELRNGASVVLGDTILAPGHYTQIRLIIGDSSNIVINGIPYDLEIPSGMQTGVKLIHGFDIQAGMIYELMLDFDAEKSIVATGSDKYILKPTIRLTAVALSGSVSGVVLPPDVATTIWTVSDSDTISTYSDITGAFKLMTLPAGTYDINITSANPAYRDSVITDVEVLAGADTDIGTVTIFP